MGEEGEVGDEVGVAGDCDEGDGRADFFELGRDDGVGASGGDGEGDEGGWHVHVMEGAGHGIFSADGGKAEFVLSAEGSEEGGEGESPAAWVGAEFREIFLEGEADVGELGSGGDDAADGFSDGVEGAVEGAPAGEVGVKSPGHVGGGGGVAFEKREGGDHGIDRGALVDSAEGRENGAGADG